MMIQMLTVSTSILMTTITSIVVGRILMNSGLYLQLNRAGIPPTRSWLTLMVMDCLTVKSIGASSLNVPISLAIT